MGKAISCLFDTYDDLFDRYYPKLKWLQPRYLTSTLMASSLAYTVYMKPAQCLSERVATFVFLGASGATLGLQSWVFFVNGLTMMRLLPRHQFGLVQSHLFPKFFFLTSLFNYASLNVFLKANPLPLSESKLPIAACLASSFFLNVLNMTCFSVHGVRYNLKMHEIERNTGEGLTTVGKLVQNAKCESDPEYMAVKSKFNRFHGYSALSGFLSFGATVAQFYFLSDKGFFSI